jgi:hypothetical protein
VNIALGSADVLTCLAGDANGDAMVTVNEIVAGVNATLNGCLIDHVINEVHLAVAVPGSFTLDQANADPESIVVFLRSPLPPFQLIRLVESVDYVVIPSQDTFEIRIVVLPPELVVPGTYDFLVDYGFA